MHPSIHVALHAVIPALLVVIFMLRIKAWLLRRLQVSASIRYLAVFLELAGAILLTAIAGIGKLWDLNLWKTELASMLVPLSWFSGAFAAMAMIRVFQAAAKDKDQKEIKDLQDKITQIDGIKNETQNRLDVFLELVVQIREVIDSKGRRVIEALRTGHLNSYADLIAALNPGQQARLLIQAVHVYFSRKLKAGHRIRVGLYLLKRSPRQLERAFAWDGQAEDCFSGKSQPYFDLDQIGEATSVLVQILRSDEAVSVYSSCEKEHHDKDSLFNYLHPDQKNYLKSLLVFKYVFKAQEDAEAMVVTLDTDQDGFFQDNLETDYSLFLVEVAARLEYEFVVSSATMVAGGRTL